MSIIYNYVGQLHDRLNLVVRRYMNASCISTMIRRCENNIGAETYVSYEQLEFLTPQVWHRMKSEMINTYPSSSDIATYLSQVESNIESVCQLAGGRVLTRGADTRELLFEMPSSMMSTLVVDDVHRRTDAEKLVLMEDLVEVMNICREASFLGFIPAVRVQLDTRVALNRGSS